MTDGLARAFAAGDPRAVAIARARAYALFARFVRYGVEPGTYPYALGIEELAPGVTSWEDDQERFDPDRAAADHHRILGLEVPPLASVFLDPTARAGGTITETTHALLRSAGIPVDPTGESADHLAVLLDGLAFLSAAEAEAEADGEEDRAWSARAHARRIVETGVLVWWPPFAEAVRYEGAAFHSALVELLTALFRDQVAAAPRVEAIPPTSSEADDLLPVRGAPPEDGPLPGLPGGAGGSSSVRGARPDDGSSLELGAGLDLLALLDRPETDLRAIADHLLRPARSGLHLSRGALARVGREVELPRGFGSRSDQLLALFRGAVENDLWPVLVDALLARVDRAARAYAADDETTFSSRLRATRAGLERLRHAPSAMLERPRES